MTTVNNGGIAKYDIDKVKAISGAARNIAHISIIDETAKEKRQAWQACAYRRKASASIASRHGGIAPRSKSVAARAYRLVGSSRDVSTAHTRRIIFIFAHRRRRWQHINMDLRRALQK